jgi:hypothetical protein
MRRRKNGVFDTTVTKPCFRVLRGSQRTASVASVVARSCHQPVAGPPLHGPSVSPGRFTHAIAAATWPDPALPPLADGMTASEAREQVNGYLTAALGITRQPASS